MDKNFLEEIASENWQDAFSNEIHTRAVTALENEKILFFSRLPFDLLESEKKFLSAQYVDVKTKNISYNILTDTLRGARCSDESFTQLKTMLQRFAKHAENLVRQLLPSYANALKIGRTSFRPIEISGRVSSYRKDDTRLHVDAFPATPNQGQRILRVFTNINPHNQDRVWRVGEPFTEVAKRFLPDVKKPWMGHAALWKLLHITKTYRTEYDHIMLQIHNRMKKNLVYQKEVPQCEIRFAPGNSWIVQTDHVSHAAMSGQHALEQTFYLPVDAMQCPDLSPLRILEQLSGRALA